MKEYIPLYTCDSGVRLSKRGISFGAWDDKIEGFVIEEGDNLILVNKEHVKEDEFNPHSYNVQANADVILREEAE